jgi:prevent-host-death family protein
MQATTKDLRLRTKEILAASQRGEEVVITFRGEPRAVLSPLPNSAKRKSQRNPSFGIWSDLKGAALSVDQQVSALRASRF